MWLAFCFIFVYYLLYLEFEPFVSRSILSVLDAFLFGVRVPVSFSDDERVKLRYLQPNSIGGQAIRP